MAKKQATSKTKTEATAETEAQKNDATKSNTVAGKNDAKATASTEKKEVTEETVTKKVNKAATAPGDTKEAPKLEGAKSKETVENSEKPDGSKKGQEEKGPAAKKEDLDLDIVEEKEKETEKTLTDEEIEEIEVKNLVEYQKEVEKINSLEDLDKLRSEEKEGKDRDGAYAVLDRRVKQLTEEDAAKEKVESAPDKIKRLRVKADGLISYYNSHMAIANDDGIDRLFLAKCWMGKMLGETGVKNPYNTGKRLVNPKDIPATADVAAGDDFQRKRRTFSNYGVIEALDLLREETEEICEELKAFEYSGASKEMNIARTNAYNYFCEAKFFMGRQLSEKRR